MGQRRRAMFAACLVGYPQYILLDEPLEGMDLCIQKKILEWIDLRVKNGAYMIVVSHSIDPFLELATKSLTIYNGQTQFFESLPSASEEKLVFLKNLAQGLLPK